MKIVKANLSDLVEGCGWPKTLRLLADIAQYDELVDVAITLADLADQIQAESNPEVNA